MKQQSAIGLALIALALGGPCVAAEGQRAVVIHAGQLFDGKSDRLASKQIIVIQGGRIADVGPEGSVRRASLAVRVRKSLREIRACKIEQLHALSLKASAVFEIDVHRLQPLIKLSRFINHFSAQASRQSCGALR